MPSGACALLGGMASFFRLPCGVLWSRAAARWSCPVGTGAGLRPPRLSSFILRSSLSGQSKDGQDQSIDHARADAVDDHWPCDREDLDRRARDKALGLEFQRRGHDGVCKPRDRHQPMPVSSAPRNTSVIEHHAAATVADAPQYSYRFTSAWPTTQIAPPTSPARSRSPQMGERGESESTNAAYSSLLMRIDLISCAQYGRARAKLCKMKRLRADARRSLLSILKCLIVFTLRRENGWREILDDLRRIADRDRIVGYVLRHDGGGADDRAFSE